MSDLHASDARYHRNCKPSFMGIKSLKTTGVEFKLNKDPAFSKVITKMELDTNKLWSSVDVQNYYNDNNGTQLQRWSLAEALGKHFGDNS